MFRARTFSKMILWETKKAAWHWYCFGKAHGLLNKICSLRVALRYRYHVPFMFRSFIAPLISSRLLFQSGVPIFCDKYCEKWGLQCIGAQLLMRNHLFKLWRLTIEQYHTDIAVIWMFPPRYTCRLMENVVLRIFPRQNLDH